MTRSRRARVAAAAAAPLLLLATAAPAAAGPATDPAPTEGGDCLTQERRAQLSEHAQQLSREFALARSGRTAREAAREALHEALEEVRTQKRLVVNDHKLSKAERRAKQREVRARQAAARKAQSQVERRAIRAEIASLRAQLAVDGSASPATPEQIQERIDDLRAQIKALRDLRRSDAAALKDARDHVRDILRCEAGDDADVDRDGHPDDIEPDDQTTASDEIDD